MCSTIAVDLNSLVLFLSQRLCFGIFPIHCFLRDNSPKIEYLAMLLLYASGTVTNLIDVFIEFINKESVLYISVLEFMSDACSEIDIRVETIHGELSRYGNIKAFHC